jgi:hypothetical protein
MKDSNTENLLSDEETAQGLRDVGLAVSEDVHPSELYRRVALPAQARMREEAKENEKVLKGFYMAWLFDKLNLNAYR